MDRLAQLSLLVQIAETDSLQGAAAALRLSVSAANRHLMALESRLGVQLVDRGGRRVVLTRAGAELCGKARAILGDIDLAEQVTHGMATQARGVLRVSCTFTFAMTHVVPLLPEYTQQCPDVAVQIDASNRYPEFLDSSIDIAIRTRDFEPDSSITIRRLAETDRILAATPAYLRRHGAPADIEDLQRHRFLIYSYATTPHELHLARGRESAIVNVESILTANDSQVLRVAALNHLGIVVQPTYVLDEDLVGGRLVPVLNEWRLSPLAINLAFPSRKHLSGKVRSFVDCISARFDRMQYTKRWTQHERFAP